MKSMAKVQLLQRATAVQSSRYTLLFSLFALLLAFTGAGQGQTQVDLSTQAKLIDFSTAASTRPAKTGTVLPATCQIGELFFRTNATVGQNLFGCVANNSWSVLSSGTGGGSTTLVWNDLKVSRVSGSQLIIGESCTGANPCSVRFGKITVQFSAPITANITSGSGSGLARVYVLDTGVILVEHSTTAGITVSCSLGCTPQQSPNPEFSANGIALADVLITNGAWGTVTDRRSMLSNRSITAGVGILVTEAAGSATIEIDPADVPRLGASNNFTGTNNFATGAVVLATGAPSSSSAACTTGEIRLSADHIFVCTATNTWKRAALSTF